MHALLREGNANSTVPFDRVGAGFLCIELLQRPAIVLEDGRWASSAQLSRRRGDRSSRVASAGGK